MYRVFISTPGDLEPDRDIVRSVVSSVNETDAMPDKILLVSVGLPNHDLIVSFRSAVSQNIRDCTYFIQVFQDDWGPKDLFRKMFFLSAECRDDAGLPMRDVVVCLKAAPHEIDPQILAFRKELEDRQDVRVFHYDHLDQLKTQLAEVCKGWVHAIQQSSGGGSAGAAQGGS